MKPDNFEQHLQRRKIKRLPREWRAEILSAAYVARAECETPEDLPRVSCAARYANWAALAAVWFIIAVFQVSNLRQTGSSRRVASVASESWDQYLREERQLLTELIEPTAPPAAGPTPKRMPPRSGDRAKSGSSTWPA